jgi:hypothetical protein
MFFRNDDAYENRSADIIAEIENTESNHLGIPLPEGTVRVFKKDTQNRSWFVGEGYMVDTKLNEKFKVKISSSNEIDGCKKLINKNAKESSYSLEIRNSKDKAVEIAICDLIRNLRVSNSSEKYVVVNDTICRWDVKIAPNSNKTITYSTIRN